ncbi:zinc finger, CCHC-type containing protein [Tanacetum coccineum]
MASMNTRLNIKKLDVNIIQKHGGSKQVGFKQLGPGVETGVHEVHDVKRVWFEVELQGAQGDREAEVFQVSNDDAAVAQRRLEDKQLEENTNTDGLVKEKEKEHLGIKVGTNIMVTGVPEQEGAEGNVAGKKKVKESMKANLGKLLKYNAWSTSCEKGESPDVRDKNDEVLDVMDEFPTLEEALNRTQSTEYDGNLNMNKPMTEKDTESNNKQAELIPTAIDEGREVVILEDDMVIEGSKKWMISLCGDFVGYKMSYVEIRYNLGRMGWNSGININKHEPKSLPLWIKLYNVPLIAWTVKRISAIASSPGRPLIMDKTTTKMCRDGTGRVGYVRVLFGAKGQNKAKVRYEFRPKEKEVIKEGTRKPHIQPNKNIEKSRNGNVNNSLVDTNFLEDIEDAKVFDGIKKSEHEIVDKFVDYQRQPTMEESKDWSSEMFNKRGCIIIVGWNSKDVNVMQVHSSSQAILCLIETVRKEIVSYEKTYERVELEAWQLEEAIILKEYNIPKQDKEKVLYQQDKIECLSDGDINIKFFYVVVKGRAHRNKIEVICNEQGDKVEGKNVASQFVKYFQEFLGKEVPIIEMEPNTVHITNKVSMENATMMTKLVNDEEVKKALFDICDNKALGPDGFTSKFYKKAWNIIGKDVYEAVKEFFST